MQRYPIRVGRPVTNLERGKDKPKRKNYAEKLFFRAAVLVLCGAAVVVSFFSVSLARGEGQPAETDAVFVMASREEGSSRFVSSDISGEGALRASTDGEDNTVWSYIEGLMRRLFVNEGD